MLEPAAVFPNLDRNPTRRLATLALAVVLATGAACSSDERRAATHTRRAEEHLAARDPGAAIVELRSALSYAPDSLEARWRLGAAYLDHGYLGEAKFYITEAYRLAPDNDQAVLKLADIYVNIDPERADELISTVLERNPESAAAHVLRAEQMLLQGDSTAAMREARRGIELAPDQPDGYWKLERILETRRRERFKTHRTPARATLTAALDNYDRLLELDPDRSADIWLGRAEIYVLRSEDAGRAEEAYARALDEALRSATDSSIRKTATKTMAYAGRRELHELREKAVTALIAVEPENVQAWEALAYLRRVKNKSADDLFEPLFAARPRDPEAHLVYARYLHSTQDLDAAIEYLDEQIAHGIDPPRLLSALAEMQLDAGRLDQMYGTAARLKERYPSHWRSAALTAHQQLSEGNFAEAAKLLRTLVRRHPDPTLLRRLAALELELGNHEAALAAVRQAIRKTTRFPLESKRLLARIQHDAGDYPGAVTSLTELARYGELPIDYQFMLSRSRYRTGNRHAGRTILMELLQLERFPMSYAIEFAQQDGADPRFRDVARAALEKSLARYPNNADLQTQLAAVEIADGDFEPALARLDRAIFGNRNSVPLRMLRAQARVATGDRVGGARDANAALMRDPELRSGAIQLLVALAVSSGRVDETIQALENAADQGQIFAGTYVLLGRLYMVSGEDDKARALFERIIEADPALTVVKNDLAYLLARNGIDLDRALILARQAVEELEDNPSLVDTLGYVYLRRDQPRAALREFRNAATLSRAPNAEIQYHIALALMALEHDQQAIRSFARSLQIDPDFPQAADARIQLEVLRSRLLEDIDSGAPSTEESGA